VKESQEDGLVVVVAIVRGERLLSSLSLFEGRAFSHGTHAQGWLIVKL
jgi:hypothetical protein